MRIKKRSVSAPQGGSGRGCVEQGLGSLWPHLLSTFSGPKPGPKTVLPRVLLNSVQMPAARRVIHHKTSFVTSGGGSPLRVSRSQLRACGGRTRQHTRTEAQGKTWTVRANHRPPPGEAQPSTHQTRAANSPMSTRPNSRRTGGVPKTRWRKSKSSTKRRGRHGKFQTRSGRTWSQSLLKHRHVPLVAHRLGAKHTHNGLKCAGVRRSWSAPCPPAITNFL